MFILLSYRDFHNHIKMDFPLRNVWANVSGGYVGFSRIDSPEMKNQCVKFSPPG